MFSLNTGLYEFLFEGTVENEWHIILAYIGFVLITIFGSYLLGSINSAIIISKTLYHDDIRKHGSGNAGMTNMLRTYGLGAAGLTLLGDLLKTVISISIAGVLFGFGYSGGVSTQGLCYVAGLFAVVGHIFPIYYGLKGGKGVLSTATAALVLSPVPFAFLFVIFVIVVWISKYVYLGSVIVAVLYPITLHGYFSFVFANAERSTPGYAALSAIILAILIVWCHRGNLQRISNKTERKLSFKKKEKKDDEA